MGAERLSGLSRTDFPMLVFSLMMTMIVLGVVLVLVVVLVQVRVGDHGSSRSDRHELYP
jgi:hypothetical protein